MKKIVFGISLVIVLLSGYTYSLAESLTGQVSLILTLHPDHTLPGIPVSLKLTATNTTRSLIVLPNILILKVIPKDGNPFFAEVESNTQFGVFPENPGVSLKLVPGRTTEFFFPVDAMLNGPDWFFDSRLSWPGIYRLEMIVDPNADPSLKGFEMVEVPRKSRAQALSAPISSTEAILTVDVPQGEDAIVWTRMLELTDGKGWGRANWLTGPPLVEYIWKEHPNSSYAPYIAAMVPAGMDEKIAILERTVAMQPLNPMIDVFHRSLAGMYEAKMYYALNIERDVVKAREAHAREQENLGAVLAVSENAVLRGEAKNMMLDWQEILKSYQNSKISH